MKSYFNALLNQNKLLLQHLNFFQVGAVLDDQGEDGNQRQEEHEGHVDGLAVPGENS